jgi:6-phosphogluconolactonase (cycloisomerase 2 family)
MAFEGRKYLLALTTLLTVTVLAACGGGSLGGGWLNLITAITVTPSSPTLAKGRTQAFTATETFQDGSTLDVTDDPTVKWTSTNTSAASVSVTGVATAKGIGTTTITATLSGGLTVTGGPISGSTSLIVTAPTVVSLAVTPANPALELGSNQALTATGTLTDGSKQDVTQSATWSSSDASVVRVNTSAGRVGVVNTRGSGSADVKATVGAVSGQTTVTVTRRTPKFLYAANLGASTLSAFQLDPATGALSGIGTAYPTSSGSTSIAVTRDFKFLYSADFGLGNISGFVIQPDGTLIAASGTPLAVPGGALGLVAHPTADFLYVAQGPGIAIYAIDPASGALTAAGAVSAANAPEFGAIAPDGRHYYQTFSSIDQIAPFAIDAGTGALTPLSAGPAAAESFPRAIAIDPAGKFLYVAISDSGSDTSATVDGFLIDPTTGALTKMPSSPFLATTVPDSIAIDPSGRFLYVSCSISNVIAAFGIDPDTGTLSAIQGSPFPAPGYPLFVLADPSGQFLYAGTDSTTAGLLGYTIDQTTGALTPNAVGSAPGNIVWSIAMTY